MKPIKLSKADAKRAEKMGWRLVEVESGNKMAYEISSTWRSTKASVGLFKSDSEARSIMFYRFTRYSEDRSTPEWKSCRKAILLCMGGIN